MRLALFASGRVGRAIASVLAAGGVQPVCVVIDAADPTLRDDIQEVFDGASTLLFLDSDEVRGSDGAARLGSLELDLAVLAWWPYILAGETIATSRLGFLNLHPSLLPYGRGKDPNFWALVEGTPFGVTIHFVDEGVDTGPIAFQRELEVGWSDTGATLYERALDAIVDLFRANLARILAGDIPRIVQDGTHATFHRRRDLDVRSQVELDDVVTVRELLDLLRARTFRPHPATRFRDGDVVYEVRVDISRVDPG